MTESSAKDPDQNHEHLGETLRAAREAKKWSLSDVAAQLNLDKVRLNNLEQGDFDKLPERTFVRGYIRSYAALVKLDPSELVAQFDELDGVKEISSNVTEFVDLEEKDHQGMSTILRISTLVLIVVLAFSYYYWSNNRAATGSETEQNVAAESTAAESTAAESTTAESTTAESTTAESTTAESTTAESTTAESTTAESTTAESITDTDNSNSAETPSGEGTVAMNFTADCWLRLTDKNGRELFSGIKHQGDELILSGEPPLSLRLGVARGVKVIYNNEPVDLGPYTKSGGTAYIKLGL